MYLFVDTTKEITVGILDKNFAWSSYKNLTGVKGSAQIHASIHTACLENQIQVRDLMGIVQIAGPGSYTGMRVSDGISQILRWQNIKTYSLYHFDIPLMIGVQRGLWIANAFKSQFFVYSWDGNTHQHQLISHDDLQVLEAKHDQLFTSYPDEKLARNYIYTSDLVKTNSKKLFEFVIGENLSKELYYFRTIEQEFKRKENE